VERREVWRSWDRRRVGKWHTPCPRRRPALRSNNVKRTVANQWWACENGSSWNYSAECSTPRCIAAIDTTVDRGVCCVKDDWLHHHDSETVPALYAGRSVTSASARGHGLLESASVKSTRHDSLELQESGFSNMHRTKMVGKMRFAFPSPNVAVCIAGRWC